MIGRDPDQIEDIWQSLFRGTYWRGGPVLMTALAGIDLALWDIKGKRAGLPVCSLLGGKTRDGALAYAHCSGSDFQEVEDNARGQPVVQQQAHQQRITASLGCVRLALELLGLPGRHVHCLSLLRATPDRSMRDVVGKADQSHP